MSIDPKGLHNLSVSIKVCVKEERSEEIIIEFDIKMVDYTVEIRTEICFVRFYSPYQWYKY